MVEQYKDPWADASNQVVGALYKYYLSKPNPAALQEQQMRNQLLGLKIQGGQDELAANRLDLAQKQQQRQAADLFASAYNEVPQVRGPVPTDDSMGPVMPVTQADRNQGIASVFEQFAPRLDKDTVEASRDALGTAGALRFEDPIQRQLALDEKATSYENLMPGYTLSPGQIKFGPDNKMIQSAPFKTGGGSYIEQPDGTIISIDGGTPPLRPNVEGNLQTQQVASAKLKGLMNYTRNLANEDPMNFGFPGFVKGSVQDVSTLLGGVTTALGYEQPEQAVNDARQRILASGVDPALFSGLFDPTLPALQTAGDLLVYQAASAMAGQSGRDLSNQDVANMRKLVGSSTDWFTSQDKFLSKLNVLEDILNLNDQVVDRTLGGNVTGDVNPQQTQTDNIEYDYIPGQGLVPRGQ